MLESRRSVLRAMLRAMMRAASASIASFSLAAALSGQDPSAQLPVRPGEDDANLPLKPSTKAILDENQKDIKKNVEKLFELASQLKAQVEKTDSTTTLSLALVRKAEEIEKLAHQIKERAKG